MHAQRLVTCSLWRERDLRDADLQRDTRNSHRVVPMIGMNDVGGESADWSSNMGAARAGVFELRMLDRRHHPQSGQIRRTDAECQTGLA